MDREDLYDTLNDLIETCEDGRKGFADAAEHLTDRSARQAFVELGRERGRFAAELRDLVRRKGGEAHEDDSMAAAFHRAWLSLKDALGGGDHAILAEAERGEDHAVSEYQDALDKNLPDDVRVVVERQYQVVKGSHDRVRALRDSPEISAT